MFVRFACVSFSCLLFLFTIYANSEVLHGSVEEYSLCAKAIIVLLLLHQQSAPYYCTRTTSVPGAVTVQGIQYYYMMYTLMYK